MSLKIKKLILGISSLILIISLCVFVNVKNTFVSARENNVKKTVQKFNGKPYDKIKLMDKQKKIANKNVYEVNDDEYSYYLDSNYEIQNIVRYAQTKVSVNKKLSKDEAKNAAVAILKNLKKTVTDYDVDISDRNLDYTDHPMEKNEGYTVTFKSNRTSGSFVYIDLLSDGTLMGAQVHDEKLNNDDLKLSKITKENGIDIFNGYFKTHEILKDYVKEINANYSLEQISFHEVAAWKLSFKISRFPNFTFIYIIDANTGDFLVKSEPAVDGFKFDEESAKRLDNIVTQEASK
jgi:hypothetical protein